MIQPSEIIAVKVLPAIRAQLARALLKDYHLRQVEVAKRMGITQAAVSHYNTRDKSLDRELLQIFPEIQERAAKLAGKVAKGLTITEQAAAIEELCKELTKTERFCAYHRRFSSMDSQCQICMPARA